MSKFKVASFKLQEAEGTVLFFPDNLSFVIISIKITVGSFHYSYTESCGNIVIYQKG